MSFVVWECVTAVELHSPTRRRRGEPLKCPSESQTAGGSEVNEPSVSSSISLFFKGKKRSVKGFLRVIISKFPLFLAVCTFDAFLIVCALGKSNPLESRK